MKPMQFYGEFEDEVGHYLVECGLFCSSSMKIKSIKIIIYLCSGWIRYCQTFHILTKSFQYNFAPTTIPLVDNYNINRLSQAQPPPSFETARIYWSVSPDSYTSTLKELNKCWQSEMVLMFDNSHYRKGLGRAQNIFLGKSLDAKYPTSLPLWTQTFVEENTMNPP